MAGNPNDRLILLTILLGVANIMANLDSINAALSDLSAQITQLAAQVGDLSAGIVTQADLDDVASRLSAAAAAVDAIVDTPGEAI